MIKRYEPRDDISNPARTRFLIDEFYPGDTKAETTREFDMPFKRDRIVTVWAEYEASTRTIQELEETREELKVARSQRALTTGELLIVGSVDRELKKRNIFVGPHEV